MRALSIRQPLVVASVDVWKVTEDDVLDYDWHLRNPRRVRPECVKGGASIFSVDDDLIEAL